MIKMFPSFRAAVVAAACVGGISSVAIGSPLRVSVMGDSYSSWNPADLPGHYAASCAANGTGYGFGFAGITDVNETYWMKFIHHVGGTLEMNNSWESSRVTNGGTMRKSFIHPDRIDDIGSPDILLVCGGMNDAWGTDNGVAQLGDFKYSDWTADDLTKFRPALAYLIDHQKTQHPDMEIIVVINSFDDAGGGTGGRPGLTREWCASMAQIADHYGVLSVQCHDIEKYSEHPTATGFTAMANQIAAAWDAEHPAVPPATFEEADPSARSVETPEGIAYVFTNAAHAVRLTTGVDLCLVRALLVGGGGEGGHVIGGGGGGGAVVERTDILDIPAGSELRIKVGAGGSTPGKPADGLYMMNQASWHRQSGANGSASVFSFSNTVYSAAGGGGGASWNTNIGGAGASGGGGSGEKTDGLPGLGGEAWDGNKGGDVSKGGGPFDYFAGGGGGASAAGEDGGTVPSTSGRGGEGRTVEIAGTNVVYGSGGGGGGGNAAIAAAGGTNGGAGGAGNAGNPRSPLGQPGFPGVDGAGAGGGGGGFELYNLNGDYPCYTGGNGGSGAIILVFAPSNQPSLRVAVAENPKTEATINFRLTSVGEGAAQAEIFLAYGTPGHLGEYVSVGTLPGGASGSHKLTGLARGAEYAYSVKAVTDAQPPAEVVVNGSFATLPPFQEVTIEEADPSARTITTTEGTAYVFTNTAQSITFAYARGRKLLRALVVGGGGEGGHIIAGGGGGGEVVELDDERFIPAETTVTIRVGKGGSTVGKPGRYDMNAWSGHYLAGVMGESSTLTIGSTSCTAFGGGGGWSWDSTSGGAGANGGGGAGEKVANSYGYGLNGGHDGGRGGILLQSPYDIAAGGGAGAGEGGEDGGTVAMTSGRGGEGVTNSITGVAVVYGSGGGGGGGNGIHPAAGGTNGGDGGTGNLAGDVHDIVGRCGYPGVDGTGSGGGGGGFKMDGLHCYTGGNGGCGTVILVFKEDSPATLIMLR
ncbi:MAG: glycine-rich domain-containing protein [Kiritimatiellia bacterium]|jgi:hypothetical protein